MIFLNIFELLKNIIFIAIMAMYAYQVGYILISMILRKVKPLPETEKKNRFAIMISARNESGVIHELLDSLKKQDYDSDYYDIYVVADNCTDNTAEIAEKHGATVFERFNTEEVGKGYALNCLYHKIIGKCGHDYYDGYIVFDADNIVDEKFITEVNKKWATGKYDALTTYRNSKNFGTNWLTAAYSIWFMHESRHLSYVRDRLGAQCLISGTGFVVSEKVMKANNGWPYYFMTEDIQFSVDSTIKGYRIGYVDSAILYDEQPSSMKQSWNQRLRWAKGFYQIDGKYLPDLVNGFARSKGSKRLGFYDVFMTCIPCSLLTIGLVIMAVYALVASAIMPYYVKLVFQSEMLEFFREMLLGMWQGMMLLATVTVISEWDRIHTDAWTKIKYIWIFPMYMLTYLPITLQALITKVEWKPIQHYSTAQLASELKR